MATEDCLKSRMREIRTYGSVRGSDIPSQVNILERSVELSTRLKRMLLTEYDEAKTMELFKEEGRAEGRAEDRAEGREQGFALGMARLARLMSKLFSQGRGADAERAANDEAYRNRLFEEYGID